MTIELNDLDEEALASLVAQMQERREVERADKKNAEKEREVKQIWTAIDSGNYQSKRDRVAYLLNLFPDTRKSDITLSLRYWETFQREHFDGGHVLRHDLFRLERQTTIARLRAKIQNEYGLFLPDEAVVRRRRRQEEEIKAEMLADLPPPNLVHVFADETGKNGNYIIIGSVWFLNVTRTAVFQAAINTVTQKNKMRGEFHFAESKKQHLEIYKTFVDVAAEHREFLSFRAIIAINPGGRDIEGVITRLLRLHLLKGYEHEMLSGRISSPRRIHVTLDEGATMSSLAREELRLQLCRDVMTTAGEGNNFERIAEENSKNSAALQLADLLAGSLNRKYNGSGEQRNHKDDLADYVLEQLAPELGEFGGTDSVSMDTLV